MDCGKWCTKVDERKRARAGPFSPTSPDGSGTVALATFHLATSGRPADRPPPGPMDGQAAAAAGAGGWAGGGVAEAALAATATITPDAHGLLTAPALPAASGGGCDDGGWLLASRFQQLGC